MNDPFSIKRIGFSHQHDHVDYYFTIYAISSESRVCEKDFNIKGNTLCFNDPWAG